MSYDYCFKLILIGKHNSGKTSLVQRLATDKFNKYSESTIGVEFMSFYRTINGKDIKFHLWDTAGQENFAPIIKNYYKNVVSGFLVIDSRDVEWRENIKKWLERYENYKSENSLPLILLLNKIDLSKVMTSEEFQNEAKNIGLKSIEVSALTGANTTRVLKIMAEYVMENIEKGTILPGVKKGIDLKEMQRQENTGITCCTYQ